MVRESAVSPRTFAVLVRVELLPALPWAGGVTSPCGRSASRADAHSVGLDRRVLERE